MRLLSVTARALVALLPVLVACGGTGGAHDGGTDGGARDVARPLDAHPSDGGGCGLVTCASAHANCGQIGDGCGGVLNCGTCTEPDSCGGGGTANVCGQGVDAGPPPCTPRTCAAVGANCGPVSDGCGNLLDCGTCTAPDGCGAGGTPSVCGHTTGCTPRTCASVGANCGPVADGCGNLLNCGTCTAPDICGGGGTPSVCGHTGTGTTCTGLCLRRATCSAGVTTTISGTVRAPSGVDPLYNATVYIPNAPVAAFTPGVSCDRCGAEVSGSPLVSATTGPDGSFTLTDVPVGADIPLVIQLGRWRRQITIHNVASCVDNPLTADQTRLPRNHTEGDIPLMAMVTGNVDTLECVLRKIGLDDSEFTTSAGTGRVQIYVANGANASGGGAQPSSMLTGSASTLARYDMVLFACEGMPIDKPHTDQTNIINYANLGGRVFATHYSYTWLYNDAPFSGTADWNADQAHPRDPLTGIVDTSFPRGMAFSQWLTNVGASTTPGRIQIHDPRHDLDGVVAPSQRWIYSSSPNTVQHYTFNTPVGTPAANQCGRVLFSDFHVNNANSTNGMRFPAECTTGGLTPQEKVLEFMLFDLASCIAPDGPPTTCTPQTCAQQHLNCGPAGDGCGGMLDCGACTAPDTCGGGGTPSVCGHSGCTPQTCASQNLSCGPAGDGCGGMLNCGTCTPPDTCGGGGMPGVCGHGSCVPRSCADAHANCGAVADGCGGVMDCGTCTPPNTCGGGGVANVCGNIG